MILVIYYGRKNADEKQLLNGTSNVTTIVRIKDSQSELNYGCTCDFLQ